MPTDDRCSRCTIASPLVRSVMHETLCPNCAHLRQYEPDEFDRTPTYGPIPARIEIPAQTAINPLSVFTR